MKEKSFKVYIHRTLKLVNPQLHITKPALEAMDSIVRNTCTELVNRAVVLTSGSEKKTVSVSELETAVNLVFPVSMTASLLSSGQNACSAFEESKDENKEENKNARTRESRANLIFSVSATEKYLRKFGQNNYHVSALAPVFLAGVLQTFTSSVLNLSSSQTLLSKRVTINNRHLLLGVAQDENLHRFVNNLNIVFLDAGVESNVDKNLFLKKRKRTKTNSVSSVSSNSSERKVHRWRPGTKTLMDIKRLQKSADMLMQHAPFCRLVREIANNLNEKSRCTAEFLDALQALVEDRMIRVMRTANRIAIHAGRETVYARDVQFAQELVEFNLISNPRVCTNQLPEASFRKMCLRAGIKRYGDDSTSVYRTLIVQFLETYIRDTVFCALHHKVQTLNTSLMLEALSMRGCYPSITAHKRRSGRRGTSTNTETTESVASADLGSEISDVENEFEEVSELATITE